MNHLKIVSVLLLILFCGSTGYPLNLYSGDFDAALNMETIQKVKTEQDSLKYNCSDTTIIYTVKPGDNLWDISSKLLGDGFGWREIYDNNKEKIIDPEHLIPNQKLRIIISYINVSPPSITPQNLTKNKKKISNSSNASIQAQNMQNTSMDGDPGIGGLVIDRTQSKWGRDFVDLFNKNFNPPAFMKNYTIVIEEKPLPRFGTVILIKVNGNYIFQKFIQPRYETIKKDAEKGTEMALSYLANYRQIQKELQGEDLKGTGIY